VGGYGAVWWAGAGAVQEPDGGVGGGERVAECTRTLKGRVPLAHSIIHVVDAGEATFESRSLCSSGNLLPRTRESLRAAPRPI